MDRKAEKQIIDFVEDYILNDPFFKTLSKKDQRTTRNTFIIVMRAVYKANNFPNVIPIIYCHDYKSAQVVQDAMEKVAYFMPNTDKIRIEITH
jgi:hypothetical protein